MIPSSMGNKKYLKSDEVQSQDTLMFIDEGKEVKSTKFTYPPLTLQGTPHPLAGQPKTQMEIGVSFNNEDRVLALNKTSYRNLSEACKDL